MSGALITCPLSLPTTEHLDHILENAPYATRMAQPDSRLGQTVVICGAGPSLRDVETTVLAHEVWACNSALPYLVDRGARVTHGFCIDKDAAMLGPNEWGRTFDVEYLVASSVHPDLVRHLAHRPLTFFHNYLGVPDSEAEEQRLYDTVYTRGIRVGHGLNSVPRAVCLAVCMGFSSIVVYGADCACEVDSPPMPPFEDDREKYGDWLDQLVMYADGRTVGECYGRDALIAEGIIGGHRWHTRPDMVISATHLLDIQRAYPGRITFEGNTLVNALAQLDLKDLSTMPRLGPNGEVTGFVNASLEQQVA